MSTNMMTATWTAALAVLASTSSLEAHHSLAQFDTSAPVWVTGTVVGFERVNPHSRISLDREMEDGRIERWIVDGPAPRQLTRIGVDYDTLRAGDVIEVCGFEGLESQRTFIGAGLDSADLPERFMNGNLMLMPDGEKWVWSNYGQLHQCLGPDEEDLLNR